MNLIVEPNRDTWPETGIYVRAKEGTRWVNADIAHLDAASLLTWLRSRGGDNPWAEDCVGILLGHGHLHSPIASPSPASEQPR
jgi:hypothetical protein